MKLLVCCLLMCIAGCGPSHYIDNDQIIRETKKCVAAGLVADEIYNGWTGQVWSVVCEQKH